MRQNKVDKRMSQTWKRDDSKLSEEDIELLKILHFPTIVKSGQLVQKRIAKDKGHKAFNPKQNISYKDIVYLTLPRFVGLEQIRKFGALQDIAHNLQTGAITMNGKSQEERNQMEQAAEIMATKGRQDYYIDGDHMDEELEMILSTFSKPKPTPSMTAPKKEEKPKEVKNTSNNGKVKNLPNALKKQAREMYQDKGMSADEISAELEVDVQRVIMYLKKLDEKNG